MTHLLVDKTWTHKISQALSQILVCLTISGEVKPALKVNNNLETTNISIEMHHRQMKLKWVADKQTKLVVNRHSLA